MPPNAEHWLGTDDVGRDYFSRLLHAMRTAVLISILVPLLTLVIGVTLGTVSAYSGRAVDNTIMRLADVVMTIPTILFAALINASIAEPLEAVMAALQDQVGWRFLTNTVYVDYLIVFSALSLISWPGEARLIRGQILSLREQDYVLAARSVGATNKQIMLKHLVPNSLGSRNCKFHVQHVERHDSGGFAQLSGYWHTAARGQSGVDDQQIDAVVADVAASDRHPGHRVGDCDAGDQLSG